MIKTILEQLPRNDEGQERRQLVILIEKGTDPWAVRAYTEYFDALRRVFPAVDRITTTKETLIGGWKIPLTLPAPEVPAPSIPDNA